MNPTRAQLDAAEERLLKEWRSLAQAHRENRRWITYYRAVWRATRDVRATAIRAIRAMRPSCIKCDERPQAVDSGYCFACLARDRAEYAAWDEPLRSKRAA